MHRSGLPLAALVACALVASVAHAQSDAFPFGKAALGKKLYAEKCATCHASMFGGDGSSIFTPAKRRIHTAAALLAQVQYCNQQSHAGLSAEGEQSVAAWLDQAYYKLKK